MVQNFFDFNKVVKVVIKRVVDISRHVIEIRFTITKCNGIIILIIGIK